MKLLNRIKQIIPVILFTILLLDVGLVASSNVFRLESYINFTLTLLILSVFSRRFPSAVMIILFSIALLYHIIISAKASNTPFTNLFGALIYFNNSFSRFWYHKGSFIVYIFFLSILIVDWMNNKRLKKNA